MDVTPLATCLFYKMSMSAAATQVLTDRGRTCGDKQQCDASLTDHCAQLAVDGGYRLWDLRTSDLPIDPKKWLQQITVVFVCDGLSRSNSPLIKRWTRNQASSSLRGAGWWWGTTACGVIEAREPGKLPNVGFWSNVGPSWVLPCTSYQVLCKSNARQLNTRHRAEHPYCG
jgi:hypothetical protein